MVDKTILGTRKRESCQERWALGLQSCPHPAMGLEGKLINSRPRRRTGLSRRGTWEKGKQKGGGSDPTEVSRGAPSCSHLTLAEHQAFLFLSGSLILAIPDLVSHPLQ